VDLVVAVGVVEQILIDRTDHGGVRVRAIDEKLLGPRVGVVEQQLTDGGLAIAAGAARFLIVGLHAAGDFIMNHESHVRAVDAHAEGVGGDRDVRLAGDENLLGAGAFLLAHAAMIGDAFDAPAGERFGHGIDFFPRRAIDDAGLVGGDHRLHPLVLLRGLVDGGNGER